MKIPGLNVQWGTGGEYVADVLADLGVRTLISLPGSQVLPIWDGLGDRIEVVVPRTERKAAFMAEGYARANTGPAALSCTLGPGVANELVGIESCVQSGAPVLALAPYHPPEKRGRIHEVFQGLRHPEFFDGIPKDHRVVDEDSGEVLSTTIETAYRKTLSEPSGPVRVDVSFPILFRHGFRRRQPVEAPGGSSEPPVGYLAAETAQRVQGIAGPGSAVKRLAPGIDEPGFALPFALGLKLARPEVPVAVSTGLEELRANLDALELAGMHDVSTSLLDPTEDAALRPIAEAGGAASHEPIEDCESALERRLRDGPGELFILGNERERDRVSRT